MQDNRAIRISAGLLELQRGQIKQRGGENGGNATGFIKYDGEKDLSSFEFFHESKEKVSRSSNLGTISSILGRDGEKKRNSEDGVPRKGMTPIESLKENLRIWRQNRKVMRLQS